MKIIDTSNVIVTKLKKNYKFEIKSKNYTNFFKYIKTILNQKNNTFTLKANKIVGFNDFIKTENFIYKHAETFFLNISDQIKSLENDDYSMLYLNPNDIYYIEITDDIFLFLILKTENFKKIEDENLTITEPLQKSKNIFFSPELQSTKKFPTKIKKQTLYYSVGMHIVNQLNISKDDLTLLLGTKLYFALERSLKKDEKNRTLLYI